MGDQAYDAAIKHGINDMVWKTNYVMTKFGACNANIRSSMFRTYCTNYYNSPIWKLDSSTIHQFYTILFI